MEPMTEYRPPAGPPASPLATLHPRARVLPPEEWAERLTGTSLDGMHLDPDHSVVILVEDGGPGGQVLACWAAITTVHVEGLWEAPAARGHAGVARALLTTMLSTLREHHIAEVLTNAATPEVEAMLNHIGAIQLPGTAWVLDLGLKEG